MIRSPSFHRWGQPNFISNNVVGCSLFNRETNSRCLENKSFNIMKSSIVFLSELQEDYYFKNLNFSSFFCTLLIIFSKYAPTLNEIEVNSFILCNNKFILLLI